MRKFSITTVKEHSFNSSLNRITTNQSLDRNFTFNEGITEIISSLYRKTSNFAILLQLIELLACSETIGLIVLLHNLLSLVNLIMLIKSV